MNAPKIVDFIEMLSNAGAPAFSNITIFPSFPEFMLIASFSGRFNLSSVDHRRRWGIDCSSVWEESMNRSFCSYGQLHRFPHWNIDRSFFSTLYLVSDIFAPTEILEKCSQQLKTGSKLNDEFERLYNFQQSNFMNDGNLCAKCFNLLLTRNSHCFPMLYT